MRRSFDESALRILSKIHYMVGDAETVKLMPEVPALGPFAESTLSFLATMSKELRSIPEAKAYPDVITLGFWLRRASLNRLKERFAFHDNNIHMGRGLAFHIAPSNVPVNYAYSLVTGLITGNANIIRIPSKSFPQVDIINEAICRALAQHEGLRPYISLVRYDREKEINDLLSSIADVRVVWGGDATIADIRRSPMPPRAVEVAFADRFSFAVIDSVAYLAMEDKQRVAKDFYNDTFLTDQNACTSPRLVVWIGSKKEEAKEEFWNALHNLVKKEYGFQAIMGINKLTSSCLSAIHMDGISPEPPSDNLIVRVKVPKVTPQLIELRDNSGFFFEYDCENVLDLKELCEDTRVQTIGIIGSNKILTPLVQSGIKGVDRIVPVGKTMDFCLIWDGYNLVEKLTRTIHIV